MESFQWIVPLKEAVLVMFFLAFSAAIVFTWGDKSLQQLASIPLEESDERSA